MSSWLLSYRVCSEDRLGGPILHFCLLHKMTCSSSRATNKSQSSRHRSSRDSGRSGCSDRSPRTTSLAESELCVLLALGAILLVLCTAASGPVVLIPVRRRELLVVAVPETVSGISPVVGGTQFVAVLLRGDLETLVNGVRRIAVEVLQIYAKLEMSIPG